MKTTKILLAVAIALLLAFVLMACGSDSNNSGANNDPALIGTWYLCISNDIDISSINATFAIDANSYVFYVPAICTETGTYTTSPAGTFTKTITSNNCSDGPSVGDVFTYPYDVTGDTFTTYFDTVTLVYNINGCP